MQTQRLGRWTLPLFGFSYLAMANAVVRPDLIYRSYWLSIAGWHMFYGGLLCFGLLLVLRTTGWNSQTIPAVKRSDNRQESRAAVRQLAPDSTKLDAPVLPD